MQNNSDYYSGEYEIGIHRKGVKKIPYSCGRVRNFLTPTPECQIGQWKKISFFFYNFSICRSKDPEWSKSFQHLKVHRTYDANRLKWIYFTKCFIKMHNIYFRFWTFCIFFSLKNYFGCGQWIYPPSPRLRTCPQLFGVCCYAFPKWYFEKLHFSLDTLYSSC